MDFPGFSKLQILHEVLLKRKYFLNVNEVKETFLFNNILLLKALLVGYGSIKIVPKWATFIALFLNVLIPFVMDASWKSTGIEAFNLVVQTGIQVWMNDFALNAIIINGFFWYTRCLYPPSEFFLDCYVVLIFVSYIWKSYAERPHQLCYLICLLHLTNSFFDLFIPPEKATSTTYFVLFCLPAIILESINEERNVRFNPVLAIWFTYKYLRIDFSNAPVIKYFETLLLQNKNTSSDDLYGELIKRKPLIIVDENMHSLFYLLLIVKSFTTAYAMRYVVSTRTTVKIMLINLILTFFIRNASIFEPDMMRLIISTFFQYVIHNRGFPLITSAGIWFWIGLKDDSNHFFLDYYLILSIFIYIKEAYKDNWKKVATLMCYLYCVEWFSDEFIGQPLSKVMTIASLYVPVAMISACSALNCRNRLLSIAAFTLVWLVFKLQKYFECGFYDYISTFYNMCEAFMY